MPRIRRTSAASPPLAVTALALAACGSGGGPRRTGGTGGPVELKVSLFGTFGYDEVGLFAEYEAEHPGVKITYESTQGEDKYWPALQTRLSSGSGRRRRAGHRGGPDRRRRRQPGRQVDRPARHPGRGRHRPLHRRGRSRPPPPRTAPCSASAPTSARWASATAATCSARPGCPPTRPRWPRRCPTWDALPGARREVQGRRAGRQRLARLRRRALQRDHLHPAGDLLRPGRPAGLRQEPGGARRVRHRGAGRPERADRQARAVRRPRLGRRASPPAASPPSPARPG